MSVQHTNYIDLLALDPATDELVLGMTEPRPWDGSDRRGFELQEKINTYLAFALDGEMAETFPQFRDKALRLHLECVTEPDPGVAEFLQVVRQQIGFQGIQFSVKVNPELKIAADEKPAVSASGGGCCGGGSGGGGGCGCHAPEPEVTEDAAHCDGHGGCGCSH